MKKKFFIGLFVFAAIALFIFAHLVLRQNEQIKYIPQENLAAPIEIPDKAVVSYKEAVKIDKPMVVMFYVDWCGYCRKYMPTFGELANKYKDKYSFVVINCDNPENTKMVQDYHIMGFPTLFVVDKKFDLKFSVQMSSMTDKSLMQQELDGYLKSRSKMSLK